MPKPQTSSSPAAADTSDASLSTKLLRAQNDERRRLSRELHDGVGQSLAAAKMALYKLKKRFGIAESDEAIELERLLDEVVVEVRTVSYLLHPPTLDLVGLRSSILWYAEGFEERTGIRTAVELIDPLPDFDADTRTALFRVIQECLTNIHKHAKASNVTVRAIVVSNEFRLEFVDDGQGFLSESSEGLGIRGMRERLKELGGGLYVESGQRIGSSVTAVVPLSLVKATSL